MGGQQSEQEKQGEGDPSGCARKLYSAPDEMAPSGCTPTGEAWYRVLVTASDPGTWATCHSVTSIKEPFRFDKSPGSTRARVAQAPALAKKEEKIVRS
jgi:hypothetical protein